MKVDLFYLITTLLGLISSEVIPLITNKKVGGIVDLGVKVAKAVLPLAKKSE